MTQPIVTAIKKILEEKCYIDCFGGLVRKVSIPIPQVGGKTITKTYPISCAKLDECKPNQPYVELLPSNKYKSVSYLELIGPVRRVVRPLDTKYPKNQACSFEAIFRFVMSYNMKKLGYDQCSIADQIIADIMNCFKGSFSVGEPYKIPDITLAPVSYLANDVSTFGKYSHEDALLSIGMPPCEFFHIDFKAQWTVLEGCVSQVPFKCKTPIEC